MHVRMQISQNHHPPRPSLKWLLCLIHSQGRRLRNQHLTDCFIVVFQPRSFVLFSPVLSTFIVHVWAPAGPGTSLGWSLTTLPFPHTWASEILLYRDAQVSSAFFSFLFFFRRFFYWLILDSERKGGTEREREKYQLVVPLTYAVIGWFLHVPWLGIEPQLWCTGVYWDGPPTDGATWPGPALLFFLSKPTWVYLQTWICYWKKQVYLWITSQLTMTHQRVYCDFMLGNRWRSCSEATFPFCLQHSFIINSLARCLITHSTNTDCATC